MKGFKELIDGSKLPSLLKQDSIDFPKYVPNKSHPFFNKIKSAKIPCTKNKPDFLLYQLEEPPHKFASPALTKIVEMNKEPIGILMGPSGCSKTRTVYEVLSQKVGLYFTASKGKR
jgi:hypothetical protein